MTLYIMNGRGRRTCVIFLLFPVIFMLYLLSEYIWKFEFVGLNLHRLDGSTIDLSPRHQRELIELWKGDKEENFISDSHYVTDILQSDDEDIEDKNEEYMKRSVQRQRSYMSHDYKSNDADEYYDLDSKTPEFVLYDTKSNINDTFDCMNMTLSPPTPVCLYDTDKDVYISKNIRETGVWESHIIATFQDALHAYKNIGVIDLGANIGVYSLVAAKMGHDVVAVEPNVNSIKRFHKAIKLGHLENYITILQNGISDKRGTDLLLPKEDNQGASHIRTADHDYDKPRLIIESSQRKLKNKALDSIHNSFQIKVEKHDMLIKIEQYTVNTITLDDLIDFIPFEEAVMKIDIEGYEHRAFLHADGLFDKVRIRFIVMEWFVMRSFYITDVHESWDKTLVEKMISFLTSRGYEVFSLVTRKKLDIRYWFGWPEDVLWVQQEEN